MEYYKKEEYRFHIDSFQYADLNKCAWFIYDDRIYMADNVNPPSYCKELWWSFVLRKLGLKKLITFGKPVDICKEAAKHKPIEIDWGKTEKEVSSFRIRYASNKKHSEDDKT